MATCDFLNEITDDLDNEIFEVEETNGSPLQKRYAAAKVLKEVRNRALDLGISDEILEDEYLDDIINYCNAALEDYGAPVMSEMLILKLIFNSDLVKDEDLKIRYTTTSLDDTITSKAGFNKNFIDDIYQGVASAKNLALNVIRANFFMSMMADRVNGRIVTSVKSLNKNLKSYQLKQLEILFNFLKEHYSNPSKRSGNVDYSIFDQNEITMYDGKGNYTGNFDKLYNAAKRVFDTFDAQKISYNFDLKTDAITAFNAFQTLLHFDEFLIHTFGDNIEISNTAIRFSKDNKYSLSPKATNMTWITQLGDEVDVANSTNNLSKLIIASCRMWNADGTSVIPDTYLQYPHFIQVISKIKDLSWKLMLTSIRLNDNGLYGHISESLSAETSSYIATLGDNVTIATLINSTRNNPRRAYSALFEVLCKSKNKMPEIWREFNSIEQNVIMSLYKELFYADKFNNTEQEGLHTLYQIQDNTGFTEGTPSYLDVILQTCDSVWMVKNCQYFLDPETREAILLTLMSSSVDRIRRNLNDKINGNNNPKVSSYLVDYKPRFDKKVFKLEIGNITISSDLNRNLTITSNNQEYTLDTYYLITGRDNFEKTVIPFIEEIILEGFSSGNTALMNYYNSYNNSDTDTALKQLFLFAVEVLKGAEVVKIADAAIEENARIAKNKPEEKKTKRKIIEETITGYYDEKKLPKIKWDYKTIDIIPQLMLDVLRTLANALAITNGAAIALLVEDAEGNAIANTSPSRLISAIQLQFEAIRNDLSSPANSFAIISDPNTLLDIQTVREYKDLYGNVKSYNKFNTREFIESNFLYDFIMPLLNVSDNRNWNLTGEGNKIAITPSVNSDKSTISKMIINLKKELEKIDKTGKYLDKERIKKGINVLQLFLLDDDVTQLLKYIDELLGEYYKKQITKINTDFRTLTNSTKWKEVFGDFVLNYSHDSFNKFNSLLNQYNKSLAILRGFSEVNENLVEAFTDGLGNMAFSSVINSDAIISLNQVEPGRYTILYSNLYQLTDFLKRTLIKEVLKAIPAGSEIIASTDDAKSFTKSWIDTKETIVVEGTNDLKLSIFLKPGPETAKSVLDASTRETGVELNELLHVIYGRHDIMPNNSLLTLYLRHDTLDKENSDRKLAEMGAPNSKQFWQFMDAEVILSYISNNVSIDLLENLKLYDFLELNDLKKWIAPSGRMVVGYYHTAKKSYQIASEADIIRIYNENPELEEVLKEERKTSKMPNLLLKNAVNLLKDNLELNPIIKKHNMLSYLYSQELILGSVGSHVNHPNKKAEFKYKTFQEYIADEAARFLAQHKRNVSMTASMHEFLLNSLHGIPSEYNIACILDINDYVYTVLGTTERIKPFDGATFVNPFVVWLENNSLGGERAGTHKKQFVHFYNMATGTGGIIKTAGFGITNSWMRENPFMERMMKNMTDINWIDENGKPLELDITKGELGLNESVHYDVFYLNPNTGKYYEITKIESLGNNRYRLTHEEVTINGLRKGLPTEFLTEVEANSNYLVWKNIFQGTNSRSLDANKKLSLFAEAGEASIANTVKAINSVGFLKGAAKQAAENLDQNSSSYLETRRKLAKDLDSFYQPMKHFDTHYLVTEGAIKLGGSNLNSKDWYYKDTKDLKGQTYNRMRIKMTQAGIQLDKSHHADESEISMMTQVISAAAALGHTWDEANSLYRALGQLAKQGIKEFTEPLAGLLSTDENVRIENKEKFHTFLATVIVKLLANGSQSKDGLIYNIAYDLIAKYRLDGELKPRDIYENPIPISDPLLFRKVLSLLGVMLNSLAIKLKFSGILSVLVPSHETMKIYGGHMRRDFLNPDVEIAELQKQYDANPVPQNKVQIGRTYKVVKDGKVELYHIQGPVSGEDVYGDPNINYIGYYDFREMMSTNYQGALIIEDITRGRNLAAYSCSFTDELGNSYNFYDIIEPQRLYKGEGDEKLNRRDLLDLLIRLKDGEKVIVRVNGEEKEVTINNLEILPYEVIMPRTMAKALGLKPGDNVELLASDRNSFTRKLISNLAVDTNASNFTVALKRLNGNHTYVLDRTSFNSEGMTKLQIPNPITEGTDIWRIDSKTGEKLYTLASTNDEVWITEDGKEVIVTNKVDHYLNSLDYDVLEVSESASNSQFDNVRHASAHSTNRALLDWRKAVYKLNEVEQNDEATQREYQKARNRILNNIHIDREGALVGDEDLILLVHKKGSELYTSFKKTLDIIAARIPAQSMQSFMPMKVVGYEDFDINTAYVSTHQIFLLGSDFDIDCVSLLTYELNKAGKFVGWSPYFDISSPEALKTSTQFVYPTGEKTKVDSTTKIENEELANLYISTIFGGYTITESGEQVLLFDLDNIAAKVLLVNSVTKNGLIDFSEQSYETKKLLVNAFNKHLISLNKPGKVTEQQLESLFNQIKEVVDKHNDFINDHRATLFTKNYVVENLFRIGINPANLVLATTSVDLTTGEPKSIANKAAAGRAIIYATPGNEGNKYQSIEDNAVGKEVIGISAVGLKSFFALTHYVNTILLRGDSTEITDLLSHPLKFAGREYTTIANANYRRIPNTLDNLTVLNKLRELTDNGHQRDAALMISALLSLATDNAKELCLAKLNANARMAGMYIYGLTMGIDFETLGNLLMSDIGDVVSQYLKGSIISQKTPLTNIDDVIEHLNNPLYRLKSVYRDLKLDDKTGLQGTTSVWSAVGSSININKGLAAELADHPDVLNKLLEYVKKTKKKGEEAKTISADESLSVLVSEVPKAIREGDFTIELSRTLINAIKNLVTNSREYLTDKRIKEHLEKNKELVIANAALLTPTQALLLENALNSKGIDAYNELLKTFENTKLKKLKEYKPKELYRNDLLKGKLIDELELIFIANGKIYQANESIGRQNAAKLGYITDELYLAWKSSPNYTSPYLDFIRLHLGAEEMKGIGLVLSINQGQKTSAEDSLKSIDNFLNIIKDRKDKIRQYKALLDDSTSTDESNLGVKAAQEEKITTVDFEQFFTDETYAQRVELEYDSVMFSFNPYKLIRTVPHYREYMESLSVRHKVLKEGSIKYRTLYNNLANVDKAVGKTDLSSKLRSLESLIDYKILNEYFLLDGTYFWIPEGADIIEVVEDANGNITYNSTPASKPTKIYLGTLGGNATFKAFFEKIVMPSLKLGFTDSTKRFSNVSIKNNRFIKSIRPNMFSKTPGKNTAKCLTSSINMSPKKDTDEAIILERMILEFDRIYGDFTVIDSSGNSFKIPIKDMFYFYNAVTYMNKLGLGTLTRIFDNYINSKHPTLLRAFEADLDRSGTTYNLSEGEIINWTAKVESQYSTRNKAIYVRDNDNFVVTKMTKLTDTSTDENGNEKSEKRFMADARLGAFDTDYILHTPSEGDNKIVKDDSHTTKKGKTIIKHDVSITFNPSTGTIMDARDNNKALTSELLKELNEGQYAVTYDVTNKTWVLNEDLIKNIVKYNC